MSAITADHASQPHEPPARVEEQFDDAVQQREAATLGMWIFLSTEVMFFGVLFTSYVVCRALFPEGFAEGSRHTDLVLGTIETAVLMTSSIMIVLGVRAIRLDMRRLGTFFLAATALLGAGFLVIHGFEYYAEYQEHLVPSIDFMQPGPHSHAVELFYCLYYFITGFHSLHLLIGITIIAVLTVRVGRGAFGPHHYTTLELTALYWHLVDVVWIFVFPLMYLVGRAGG